MNKNCPDKVEPLQLNTEARFRLMDQITDRKKIVRSCLVWEVKYALDQLGFAEDHVLTEDMEKVEQLIGKAISRLTNAVRSFGFDLERLEGLKQTAGEIKQSEAQDAE